TEDDITVLRDAVTQLQRVDVVVVTKSPATELHATALGEVPAHPLALIQGGRHHVHLENVGPAVVIKIGDIDAHSSETRMLEPGAGPVGERPISVVDVEDVVGGDVVGNVDVGPAVAVHVGDHVADAVPWRRVRDSGIHVVAVQQVGQILPFGRFRPGDRDVDVQVPVVVDVHHGGAGGPSVRLDARAFRDVFEPHVPFVQIQAARDHVAGEEQVL